MAGWLASACLAVLLVMGGCQGAEAELAQPSPTKPTATDGGEATRTFSKPRGGECSLELQKDLGGEVWETRSTLPCPGPEGLGVVAVGDVGLAGERLQASVDAIQEVCSQQPCQFLTIAGDLIYGPGSEAEAVWQGVWDQGLARLGLPSFAVLGNHEYRHEPQPALKRKALFASDGRAGLVLPAPAYVARIRRGEKTLLALAAIDTDSIANPGPSMPGAGAETLEAACSLQAPVLVLGHHPATSQGRHHSHEAHVEAAIRKLLTDATGAGCNIVAALAGHDHDLQAYGAGCQEAGMPAVVVSGVAARGFRAPGPQHLTTCPGSDTSARYHAGPSEDGGFALLRIHLEDAAGETDESQQRQRHQVSLHQVPRGGPTRLLSSIDW
ncbi:MAG: metallophosphoesterase [Myxococcota bacterium]|nr:metallophosphoesterase [Myxococcota bacterium]